MSGYAEFLASKRHTGEGPGVRADVPARLAIRLPEVDGRVGGPQGARGDLRGLRHGQDAADARVGRERGPRDERVRADPDAAFRLRADDPGGATSSASRPSARRRPRGGIVVDHELRDGCTTSTRPTSSASSATSRRSSSTFDGDPPRRGDRLHEEGPLPARLATATRRRTTYARARPTTLSCSGSCAAPTCSPRTSSTTRNGLATRRATHAEPMFRWMAIVGAGAPPALGPRLRRRRYVLPGARRIVPQIVHVRGRRPRTSCSRPTSAASAAARRCAGRRSRLGAAAVAWLRDHGEQWIVVVRPERRGRPARAERSPGAVKVERLGRPTTRRRRSRPSPTDEIRVLVTKPQIAGVRA